MQAVRELEQWLAEHSASAETRYFAQLAIEELGTNILKYGYDDSAEHQIEIRASWEEPDLYLWIEDDGHEFNPWNRPEPNPDLSLDERTPGGWGIGLIRRMSAGFDYTRQDGRNVVSVLYTAASPS
jgi:anti-sigma regulatory factor (Ser/Thr protein kinase)